jgi:hypothetical protein
MRYLGRTCVTYPPPSHSGARYLVSVSVWVRPALGRSGAGAWSPGLVLLGPRRAARKSTARRVMRRGQSLPQGVTKCGMLLFSCTDKSGEIWNLSSSRPYLSSKSEIRGFLLRLTFCAVGNSPLLPGSMDRPVHQSQHGTPLPRTFAQLQLGNLGDRLPITAALSD